VSAPEHRIGKGKPQVSKPIPVSTHSLTALIREVVSENPEAPARKLASIVAERTNADDLRDFYATAIEPMVTDQIRRDRNNTLNSKKGRSAKLEQRRSWWERVCAQRVNVGDAWKALGDCDSDDLEFCISERRGQVGALLGQIAKYEVIRDALALHGVRTVAELPEGAVEL
jgi:hypothetical protein